MSLGRFVDKFFSKTIFISLLSLNFSKLTNKALGSSRLSGQHENKVSQKRNERGSVILGYGYTITFLLTQIKCKRKLI